MLLAAQTHPGEDETVLPAHDALRARFPDLLTIIVPRHVERGPDIAMLCGSRAVGAAARRAIPSRPIPRSISPTRWASWGCSIAWRLSVFWAAPWCRCSGHNPLEPAVLNCAVLAGPLARQFGARLRSRVWARKALATSIRRGDIAREAERLLSDPERARAAGVAAARGAATLSGAVEKTIAALKSLLSSDARA